MRKLVAAVVTTIILISGVYTCYWFKKSDELKDALEKSIAQMNQTGTQYGKDVTLLRYESISVSGYPFIMQFDINKPVLNIPMSGILRSLEHVTATTSPTTSNFMLEVSYSDKISLTSNITLNDFSLTTVGNSTVKPTVNNEARRVVTGTSTSPFTCHLSIHNADDLPWNMPASFSDANAFLTAFRSADCSVSGVTTRYSDSDTVLSSMEFMNISATSRPQDAVNYRITLASEIKNAKASPAYDEVANSYLKLFYDVLQIPENKRGMNINFSQYGDQNNKFDIKYEGPVDRKYFTDPAARINVDVGALNIKNALYETTNEMHFSTAIENDSRDVSVIIHSAMQTTEQYEQLIVKQLTKTIADIINNPDPQLRFSAELAQMGKPEDLAAIVVPKLHTLGKIRFDADISLKGAAGKNIFDNVAIDINVFDLLTDRYGVKVKGNGKSSAGKMPVGELLTTCIVCDAMLDNIGDYAITVDSALAKARPGQMAYVTKPLVEGIKQFLHAIDENSPGKDQKDVAIHVIADDKGVITVSGKQLLEVVGLFGVKVGQNLQHEQQPSARQPAPEPAAMKPATVVAPAKTPNNKKPNQ